MDGYIGAEQGDRDRPTSSPVAIVNQTLARRYWPGEDPIGKRLKGFDPRGQNDDWLTIVGVVKDSRAGGLEKPPFSQIYEVQSQRISEQIGSLVVRTAGNPAQLAQAVRTLIHSVNHNAVVSSITTLEMLLGQQQLQRRFQTWLLSIFSGLALALAALGVFAVMHYSVAARTNEIGIRMAVGATSIDVVRLVLKSGISLAMAGVALGGLGAMYITRVLSGMLYGIRPGDPLSFLGAASILLAVAALATLLPAQRASQIDPMIALRQD